MSTRLCEGVLGEMHCTTVFLSIGPQNSSSPCCHSASDGSVVGGLTSYKHTQAKDDADNRQQAERRNTSTAKYILYRCAFLQQTCSSKVTFYSCPCSTVWATRIDFMSHGLNFIKSNIFSNFHFHYVVWKYSWKDCTFYNLLFATLKCILYASILSLLFLNKIFNVIYIYIFF